MSLIRPLFFGVILLMNVCFSSDRGKHVKIVMQALEIAKEHSINSKKLDWSFIEEEIIQQTDNINSEEELYGVLQNFINMLEDGHSFLITAGGKRWEMGKKFNSSEAIRPIYLNKLQDAGIAYIAVSPMSSKLKLDMNKYAEELYNTIISSCKINIMGWILDFRENTGGQLWPMLAGLSPLIDSDTAGYAVYPNDNNWNWWAKNGKAGVGKNIHHQITGKSNWLILNKPIAILISKVTASSGEASVISFIGKKNICLIGEKTRGLATVNQPFELTDGTILMLTTAYFGDRNKKIYPHGIEPDIIVDSDANNEGGNDFQLNTAIEWLKNHR